MELVPEDVARIRRCAGDKPRCRKCFCRWSCAGGCHVNHSYPGCSPEYDGFCIQTRLITACALLGKLGFDSTASDLVADRAEMERLALWASDRLEDLRGGQ